MSALKLPGINKRNKWSEKEQHLSMMLCDMINHKVLPFVR